MRDITHSVLARKAASKLKRPLFTTKKFIASIVIALGIATVGLGSLASANGTVNWDNQQGLTNGTPTTLCEGDTAAPGTVLWVFTASGATSATITINGTTTAMTQSGQGTFKYVSGWLDFSTAIVSATYVGTLNGNSTPQLTVSHGCPPATANVTFTKTYEQGVFTQASSGAAFTISPNTGTSDTTQTSNAPEWDGLTPGNYTISETTVPAGYAAITDISFTVANDCTSISNCVVTGGSAAVDLGTVVTTSFEDMLLPGTLQVLKQLGPLGTTWNGPAVTFDICAHDPLSSVAALTSVDCNSTSKTSVLTFPQNGAAPVSSGSLAEGYYTVCEELVSGYTVNQQCQEATVTAGDTGTITLLTFVNTPIVYWCSPGFWATAISQHRIGVLNYLTIHNVDLSTKYSTIGGASLSKKAPKNVDPTIQTVLLNPSIYGGPAFNSVADYIADQLNWGGTQLTGENCPLDAHGNLTVTTLTL